MGVLLVAHGCPVRRQAGLVGFALGLSEVVITHAVDKDHQHGPGHEEQRHGAHRVDHHPHLEPLVRHRQPVERDVNGIFRQVVLPNHPEEDNHTAQPGGARPCQGQRMAERLAAVGEQHNQQEGRQRRERKEPD